MQEQNQGDINIRRIWALVVRRRYTAIAVALVVASTFTWGAFFWPKTYEAHSTVFVERGFRMGMLSDDRAGSDSMDDRLRVLKNALTSRNIVDRVIKKLGLDTNVKSDAQHEGLIQGIINSLDVQTSTSRDKWNPDLFEISYKGGDPKMVRDLVNTLVSEYIEENAGYTRKEAAGTYDFIKGQLDEYKKKLDDSDRAVREFQEKNPGVESGSEAALAMKTDMLESARADAEVRLKGLVKRRDNLQNQLLAEKDNAAKREGPQARLDELNKKLMVLSAKYTDDYPDVRKVRGEIEEVKKQIADGDFATADPRAVDPAEASPVYIQLKQQITDTDSEAAVLKVKVAELGRQLGEARGKLYLVPKSQEEWARLQRDRSVYQKMYDELAQKLGSAGASKDLENTNKGGSFRVVDPAILPYFPSKPNTVKLIILGIFLGIASGAGAAVAIDYFSQSIKDGETVESKFGLPVLAVIQTVSTVEDRTAVRRMDMKVYAVAGAYFLVLLLVLMNEFLFRFLNIHVIKF